MKWGAVLIALVGAWVICQAVAGHALERLKILEG